MTPYLENMVMWKTKSGLEGQVIYWKGIVKAVAPFLSP